MLCIWQRRLFMIAVPLLLVVLEWNHPSGFSKNVYGGLEPISHWWQWLHIYQSFLFAAIAVGAVYLTWNEQGFFSTLSKYFILIFAVAYLVFDSTAGTSVGFILSKAQEHPEFDSVTIEKLVQLLYNDSIIGGTGSFFSLLGSWAWLLGLACAIFALYLGHSKMSYFKLIPPLFLLSISAYALYVGHYSPYGPLAFAAFAGASLWFEFFKFGPANVKKEV